MKGYIILVGERIVLMEDVVLSLPRNCGDVHMRLADFDVLGSAYKGMQYRHIDFCVHVYSINLSDMNNTHIKL